jgi:hypothetical protein
MQIEEFKLQDDPMLKKLRKRIETLFKGDNYYTGILTPLNKRDILNEITLSTTSSVLIPNSKIRSSRKSRNETQIFFNNSI